MHSTLDRRRWLSTSASMLAAAAVPGDGRAALEGEPPANTLRVAFSAAETTFDPPQISDFNSSTVAASIFESPLTFDHVARPVKLRLQTAAAMPQISADFKTFTFRIRPGIFFADDPAFKGKPRELVAQDYVYSVKRFYDPRLNAEYIYVFENAKVLGLTELRKGAREPNAVRLRHAR